MSKKSDEPDDYLDGGFFGVEIDGITGAVFRGADGLEVHSEVVEYQEGGENSKTHKLVGQTRWSNIVLRSGVTQDTDFFDWMKKTKDGTVERKNGAVIFFASDGKPKLRWDFTNGFICRWEGPRFESLESEIKLEVVEIAHDGFEMKKC